MLGVVGSSLKMGKASNTQLSQHVATEWPRAGCCMLLPTMLRYEDTINFCSYAHSLKGHCYYRESAFVDLIDSIFELKKSWCYYVRHEFAAGQLAVSRAFRESPYPLAFEHLFVKK